MVWNLVATVFAGLGAAGIALILRSLTRKKLPKWIVPAAAGLGMLGYSIYNEYTWFEFKTSQLPEGSVVVSYEANSMIWRPWTFLFPMTDTFTVLDRNSVAHAVTEDGALAQLVLYRFERSYVDHVEHSAHLLNCDKAEMVALDDEQGMVPGSLTKVVTASPLYQMVCR